MTAQDAKPEQPPQKPKNDPRNQEPRWKQREREAAEAAAAASQNAEQGNVNADANAQPENVTAQEMPEKKPKKQITPDPEPDPIPVPGPAPAPAPTPVPEPAPAPAPAPVPAPAPAPAPAPVPAPKREPAPIPASAIPDPVPPAALPSEPPRKDKGIIALCALLAVNLVGCGFLVTKMLTKQSMPTPSAEISTASADTTKKTETTEKKTETTTAKPETTTTAKTTTTKKETTTEDEKTTTQKETETTKEPESDAAQGNSASAYYEKHKGVAFADNATDPFCPPGIHTRLNNEDGSAMQQGAAIAALEKLPVDWNVKAYPVYEYVDDGNGTSDSDYRYITDAYPVPLLSKSLPAAVDLRIHNGSGNHGNYLRSVDYFFGNHADDRSGYVWTRGELYGVYNELNDKMSDLLGDGTPVSGGSYEGFRYTTAGGGIVEVYFYSNGDDTYMIRLIRSNN